MSITGESHAEYYAWQLVKIINRKIKTNESDENLIKILKEIRAEAIGLLETTPNWALYPDSVRDIGVHEAIRRFEMTLPGAFRDEVPRE